MFVLQLLPDALIVWFCNILLLSGVVLTMAGLFAHRIPLVWRYHLPFRVLGIALLVLGVYFRGGLAVEQTWRERVAELQAKITTAEAVSKDANAKIESQVVKKTEYITRRGQDSVQFVDREVVKYDTTCVIPEPFVRAHNLAAEPVK
jgi:hypothetical protein